MNQSKLLDKATRPAPTTVDKDLKITQVARESDGQGAPVAKKNM